MPKGLQRSTAKGPTRGRSMRKVEQWRKASATPWGTKCDDSTICQENIDVNSFSRDSRKARSTSSAVDQSFLATNSQRVPKLLELGDGDFGGLNSLEQLYLGNILRALKALGSQPTGVEEGSDCICFIKTNTPHLATTDSMCCPQRPIWKLQTW